MFTGVLRNPAARRFRQLFPRSLSIDGLLGKPLLDYTHRRTTRWEIGPSCRAIRAFVCVLKLVPGILFRPNGYVVLSQGQAIFAEGG